MERRWDCRENRLVIFIRVAYNGGMSTIETTCHWCGESLIRKSAPSLKSKIHFCNKKCKGEWQKTFKPVTREWLYEQYVVNGLDTTQIGHIVSRDPKSVWNWLKDFGIPRRPRGSGSTKTRFVKGMRSAFAGRKHTEENKKKFSEHAKATGRVPYDPKIGSYMKGKKGSEVPSWKGGITPERQAFYQTPEWKKAERNVKKRDKNTCQRCGSVKEKGKPFDIHHIVSFSCVELRATESNLVYLCEPCHYWVHGKENKGKEFIKEIPNAAE